MPTSFVVCTASLADGLPTENHNAIPAIKPKVATAIQIFFILSAPRTYAVALRLQALRQVHLSKLKKIKFIFQTPKKCFLSLGRRDETRESLSLICH
tara:strand:- start:151 stop:441 length:291 start_codon:yes stop_codon:yes gene_type:complete